ncbi:substrate-binding domain-containing protein [Falsiroseomonas sp.]|uniref:substrate-binding domain-containing protein n=1 Tax=Falsiroseomonas sp. TaxID=2870721 RepID=UPI003561D871
MTVPRDSGALRIFVPVAIRAIFARLAPRLEAAAKRAVVPVFDLNPAIPERILAGEAYDIGLTNPPYVDALVAAGRADGASHRPFGRIPLAIGRRAGVEGPVLTDAAGIAALLRGAESIAYTGDGTSGRTYLDAIARLGLAEAVAPKSRPMGAGGPVASVAAGEAELAVGPLTTIMASPGVVPAAIFPAAAGAQIDMSVFLSTSRAAGAAEVLGVLTGAELDAELAAAGVMRLDPRS